MLTLTVSKTRHTTNPYLPHTGERVLTTLAQSSLRAAHAMSMQGLAMVAHALAQLSFSGPQVERRMCPVPHAYIPQLHTHTHKHTGTAVLLRSSCKKTHVLCAARITFTCTHTHTHTLTHTHTGAAVLHVKRRMCPVPHAYISHLNTQTLAQPSFFSSYLKRRMCPVPHA